MFGLMGLRGVGVAGPAPPPSLEMLPDPEFDSPGFWDVGSPPGTIISGGIAISNDDSGVQPCSTLLLENTAPGTQYRLRVDVQTNLEGSFRVELYDVINDATQIAWSGTDQAQMVNQVFTADAIYSQLQIRWFEFSIVIRSISLEPVTP